MKSTVGDADDASQASINWDDSDVLGTMTTVRNAVEWNLHTNHYRLTAGTKAAIGNWLL